MGEHIINKSRKKLAMFMFVALMLVLLNVYLIYLGVTSSSILFILIGAIGIAFFGAAFIMLIKMYRGGDVLLIINEDGFYDYSTIISTRDQLIHWGEVSRVQYAEVKGQKFINIHLKNPQDTLKNLSDMSKKLTEANRTLGYEGINISTSAAQGMDAVDIAELMNTYLDEYNKK